jgi:hypothetical protein
MTRRVEIELVGTLAAVHVYIDGRRTSVSRVWPLGTARTVATRIAGPDPLIDHTLRRLDPERVRAALRKIRRAAT